MKEKIDEQLQKVKKRQVVEHIDDCFFEEVEESGCLFQVRRTNVQREGGRTLDIPDEIEIAAQEALRLQEEEAKRDITYEEYKAKFEDHIEGRAKNERVQEESADEEPANVASKSNPKSKKEITNLNKTASNFNVEDDEDAKSKASGAVSKKSLNKSTVDVRSTSKQDDTYKYDLPESCFVSMMKKVKIEKFKNTKFLLCANPFPMIEGQMICFQPKKDDQKVKEAIVYRDYSLRKRLETQHKPDLESFGIGKKVKYTKESEKDKVEVEAKLQCLEIDNETPLSSVEWTHFAHVIDEVQGLGWFQILPTGQKSSQPYQFNMLHILPSNKIPVPTLPIDLFISNHLAYLKKSQKRKAEGKYEENAEKTPREE